MLISHWLKSLRNRLHYTGRARISRKRKHQRIAPQNVTVSVESLEDRVLLAGASPNLLVIVPNNGVFEDIQDNNNPQNLGVLESAPRELMFRFSEGQTIDPNSLLGIEIVGAGFDGNFTQTIPADLAPPIIGERPNEVIVRFKSELPDDLYQIRIRGTGNTPLRNNLGLAFNSGVDRIFNFEVDRGAQIEAVVHQPILRNQTITINSVAQLNDGDTFTLQSGGATLTFEFDNTDLANGFNSNNVRVAFSKSTHTANIVAGALRQAIQDRFDTLGPAFGIQATQNGASVLLEGQAFSPNFGLPAGSTLALNTSLTVSDANLVQRQNLINVYFNANDPLDPASAQSPAFYRLVNTNGNVMLPVSVVYNANSATATLDFGFALDIGTYQLRIGESFEGDNRITPDPLNPLARPVNLGAREVETTMFRDAFIGGNPRSIALDPNDVDLYRFELNDPAEVRVFLLTNNGLAGRLRVFNSTGTMELGTQTYTSGNITPMEIVLNLQPGVYFLGVSSVGNDMYNPVDGSNAMGGASTGSYRLHLNVGSLAKLPDGDGTIENDTFATAQELVPASFTRLKNAIITRSTEIPHVTIAGNSVDTDLDYYSFTAKAGDKGIFDIDNANFDSKLFLFNAAGDLLAQNDNRSADPGSTTLQDAFLQFDFTVAGDYVIAVSSNTGTAGPVGVPGANGVITGSGPVGIYDLHVSVGGNNSSFDTATELGNLGTAGQIARAEIEPEIDVELPPEPGGNDEPGHRDIPITSNTPQGSGGENHLSNGNQGQTFAGPNNGRGVDPFAPGGIRTIAYNFQSLYGQDPDGNDLFNVITEEQKQRVREIFELFSMVSGVQFVEAATVAEAQAMGATFDDILTIATGDLRALVPGSPTGPGLVEGLSGVESNVGVGFLAVIDAGENFTPEENQYGGRYFRIAMNEIGRLLGLNHALDLDAVLGSGANGGLGIEPSTAPLAVERIFPGDHDIVHLRRLFRRDSIDIDMYKFNLIESGRVTIETLAERLENASQLNTVLTLYREELINGEFVRTVIARNDNYYGTDSFISLDLGPGTYYVGVSSVGNENYNPRVLDSGSFGTTDGAYELRLDIQPGATSAIVDADNNPDADGNPRPATALDGDGDGKAGGIFEFAFQVGETIVVDKSGVNAGGTPDGSLANPYTEIDLALAEANARRIGTSLISNVAGDHIPVIVRIVGNSGADGQLATQFDNTPYEVGLDDNLANRGALVDGGTFEVPRGVTVVFDEGALLKLQDVNIDVGSSAVGLDRSGGAVQVLGTTFHDVVFTSWHDDTRGGDSDGTSFDEAPGDWGGIVFRGDSDYDFEYNETIRNLGIPTGPSNTKIRFDDFVFTDFPVEGNEATFTITAVANLAGTGVPTALNPTPPNEFLTVTFGSLAAGATAPITVNELFRFNGANPDGFAAGDVPTPLQAMFTFTREQLRGLVGTDGTITVTITTSPDVDNLLFIESITINLKVASRVPIFLNRVNHATILYAGGPVEVNSSLQDFDAIHLIDSRPTITFNTINLSARAPISGNPDSFRDTFEDPRRYDHNRDRLGPEIHGNSVGQNSTNGVRIRTELQNGVPLETLTVPARFTSTDIVYVITENLLIEGGAGGLVVNQGVDPDLTPDDSLSSRPSGRLRIDPGVIVKLSGSRIENLLGSSNFIAEGTPQDPIIFTSINDDTFGAGGTFDTNNDATTTTINLDFGAEGQSVWIAQGPGPITNAQVENIQPNNNNLTVGAIHDVLAHPTNENILYIGSVNGGIWRTTNALDPNGPNWVPLTDFQESLSIGALVFDSADPSFNTLVAAVGRTSSFGGTGGALSGLLRSTDGGMTWTVLDGDGTLRGRNITGVVARGNTIVVTATDFAFLGGTQPGVYRSTNGGASFELLSGAGLSNLPAGTAFDIVSDPTDLSGNTMYVTIQNAGVFRSDNGGQTWVNVSVNQARQLAAFQNPGNNNAEMAVSSINGRIFVGVVINGQLAYMGFSDNRGASWTEMDLPITLESDGDFEGTSPRAKAGGQGFIHFSIVADSANPDLVYIGGDRQDSPFPNSIGANDFTARLFRGDASVTPVAPGDTMNAFSPQWAHLTHTQDQGFLGGGTVNNSAPHADSREMAFLANGSLVEVDDGGIYLRTSPQTNLGDWFSLNGDLQVTEIHNVAYDSVSNTLIGGTQDNGTNQQLVAGSLTWDQLFLESVPFRSGGDGGDVAVDDRSLAAQGRSIRYSSFQNLGLFRRQTYDASGNLVPGSEIVIDTSNVFDPQFTTPIALNNVNPLRMIIGGLFTVYEFDQGLGTPITAISNGIGVNSFDFNTRTPAEAIAYGHALNPDILYVGFGNQVFVRQSSGGALTPTTFGGNYVNGIVMDDDTPATAYVVDENDVYVTTDSGATFQVVTGNLASIAPNGGFASVEFITLNATTELLIVGGRDGVFAMRTDQPNFWVEIGTDLPNAVVSDLEYDAIDDVLVASTMGRGVFIIQNASVVLATGSGFTFDIVDPGRPAAPGDWGGITFNANSSGNLDYTEVRYGGGVTPIAGGSAAFNAIEIAQADVRISNSEFELNANGVDPTLTNIPDRNGLGANSEAVIFIRGAQPTIVTNIFENNDGNVISINANALNSVVNPDLGRATGELFTRPFFGSEQLNVTTEFANNVGPLVRNNRMAGNRFNGMEVRGGILTTEGVWDDVDIVHIVRDEIIITNLHTFGGLRLQSNARESLVVKLDGPTAGFRAAGTIDPATGQPLEGLDIGDRIGGTLQVVGTPGRPVILTSINDNTAGAGFTPEGVPLLVTVGAGTAGVPDAGTATAIPGGFPANDVFETHVDVPLGVYSETVIQEWESYIGNTNLSTKTPPAASTPPAAQDGSHEPNILTIVLDFKEPGQGNTSDIFGNVVSTFDVTSYGFTQAQFNTIANAVLNQVDFDYFGIPQGTTAVPLGQDLRIDFIIGDIGVPPVGVSEYYYVQIGTGVSGPHTNGTLGVAGLSAVRNPSGVGPNFGIQVGDVVASVFTDAINTLGGLTPANALTSGNLNATQHALAGTTSHEIGHTLSLLHLNKAGAVTPNGLPPVMGTGAIDTPNQDRINDREFSISGQNAENGNATQMHIAQLVQAIGTHGLTPGGSPGDWRGIVLDQYSNDRNVAVVNEAERPTRADNDTNSLPSTAQNLGILAPSQTAADDNRRAGFEIHGFINTDNSQDIDVYSFTGTAGTEVWFDIDRTAGSLDTVLELINANGTVLARSDNSITEQNNPSSIFGIGLPLVKDERLGGDFYTTNPKDAGMRVVLPGTVGQSNTYFIRVRSKNGLSSGEYQLQIRLRQTDEKPGSVVNFSDIRFADIGIQINGLPYRSPLSGESAEDQNDANAAVNNSRASADVLGNLLASDQNALTVAGSLRNGQDLDFYRFDIDYQAIQRIPGFDNFIQNTSVVFDIDYADGLGRADTSLFIFDSDGRLVLVSRGSNIADDLPAPPQSIQGNDFDDLSRGSVGRLDPYIGSQQLPEGTYFALVTADANFATVLSQYTAANSVANLLRLQPTQSITRIVEDHIGSQGGMTAQDPATLTPLTNLNDPVFDTSDPLLERPISSFVPWHLGDVTLVLSRDVGFASDATELFTINPFTGEFESRIGQFNRDVRDIDIYRRTNTNFSADGNIVAFTARPGVESDAATGNFLRLDSGNANILVNDDDGITTAAAPGVGIDFNAISYTSGTFAADHASSGVDKIFAIGNRGDGQVNNILFAFDPTSDGGITQTNSVFAPHPGNRAGLGAIPPTAGTIQIEIDILDSTVGGAIGGDITGLTALNGAMWAVSENGDLYQLNFNDNSASLSFVTTSIQDLRGIEFAGLTTGPPNVEGGRYADLLFAVDTNGVLYAFDTTGKLQPIFLDGAFSLQLRDQNGNPLGSAGSQIHGLSFSNLDQNLFHTTLDRSGNAGHDGGLSIVFTNEAEGGTPQNVPTNSRYGFLAGGAHGTIETEKFSLVGYSAADQPTLYFNYFLHTENTDRDAVRVYVGGINGQWTQVINNQGLLHDNSDSWRQARIDLSPFAGQSDLKLRFEFSTAGSLDIGNIFTGGTELRALDGDTLRDQDSFVIDGRTFEFDLGFTVVLPAGSQINDGDTVTVQTFNPANPGTPITTVFEFDRGDGANPSNGVMLGNRQVLFTSTDSAVSVATAFREAVTAAGIGITAIQNGRRVNLADTTGAIATSTFPETLPNGTLATAQNLEALTFTLSADQNIQFSTVYPHVSIAGTGDNTHDYYSFNVAQEHEAIFDLDNENFAGALYLYEPGGNLIVPTGGGTGTAQLRHRFDRAGTFIIGVARAGVSTGAMGGIAGGQLLPGNTYTLQVSIQNHSYGVGTHDVTNVFYTQATGTPLNGPGILVEGNNGLSTAGAVSMLINAGMTDDQVADVMRRAIANRLRANPVPLETIKIYNEVIQVLGATVQTPGRLGFTSSLPGSTPTFLPYLSPNPPKPFPFNNPQQGQNNNFEGFYFDDIIIGFAERGEVATGSLTETQLQNAGAPLITVPAPPSGGGSIQTGSYQLEIRRGTDYTLGSHPMGNQYRAGLLDTNDRQGNGLTIKIPDGEQLFDGQKFQLSDGINTVVFEFEDRELIVGDDFFGIAPTSDFAVEFRSFESAHVIASRLRTLLNSTAVRNRLNITAALADGTQTGENNGGRSSEINVFGNIVATQSGGVNPRKLSLDRNDTFAGAQSLETVGFNLTFNPNIENITLDNTSTLIPHTTIEAIGDGFLDHYSFFANQGDRVIIDVDNANFDSEIILFDEYGNLVDLNDDSVNDPGNNSGLESFIDLIIPRTGTYVIRVAQFSGNQGVVQEVETNNSLFSAQNLELNDFSLRSNLTINDQNNATTTTSTGVGAISLSETFGHVTVLGQGDGTFDYYSFFVEAGMRAFFDIDGATNVNTGLNIDTQMFLYDPRTGDVLASNDNFTFPTFFGTDNGSVSTNDPFIDFTFTTAGTYVIGVSRSGSTGNPGSIAGFPLINGDRYTLNIAIEGHDADTLPVTPGQFYTLNVSLTGKEIGGGRTDYFNVVGELEFEFFANINNEFRNLGDSNVERLQGSVLITNNQITDSQTTGILVQEPNRRTGNQVVSGSVRSLPTLNSERLVRGVRIANNVIAGFGDAGIDLQGDGAGGNNPQATVPFHRLINNTIYGGEAPTGTGVRIQDASPTLINNIIANTNIAIDLQGGINDPSNTTVVSHGLYQNNNANDRPGVSFVNFNPALPLFVDPSTRNFYLAGVAPGVPSAIDSARDGFLDRPSIQQVLASVGIPQSNLIAPDFDRFGQQRIDDPRIQNTGQGNKVFFDRGAIERVDFAGPTSSIIAPQDATVAPPVIDPDADLDFRANFVRLVDQTVRQFIIGLNDIGIGIEDLSVFRDLDGNGIDEIGNVKLLRRPDGGNNFTLLQDQGEYLLRYNTNTKQITFDAASGSFPIGEYVIVLNTGIPISLVNGQLVTDSSIPGFAQGLLFPATNPPIRDLAGNSLLPNRIDGTTRFSIELEPAPTITISDVTVVEGTGTDQEIFLTVTLSADIGQVVTVDFAVEEAPGPDAATLGVDFTANIMQGTVTFDSSDPMNRIVFNPDGSLSLTIPIRTNPAVSDPNNNITIIGDSMAERSEQFFVRLSNSTNAAIADNIGVVTILDDDLKVEILPAQISEGDSGQKNMLFTAVLLDVNGNPITDPMDLPAFDVVFEYMTSPGTATSGVDYVPTMGMVTVPAGQFSATFAVPILGDLRQEANETFFVTGFNSNGAAFVNPANRPGQGLATGIATGTILDDDPKFSVNNVVILEGDTGTRNVTFTVTATTTSLPLTSAVTVDYRTVDLTATDQAPNPDYQTATGTLTFRPIDSNQNLDPAGFNLGLDTTIQNSTTVPHIAVTASGTGVFDYYSFTVGTANSRVILDIDGANFDSQLFLYNASTGALVASNDNSPPDNGDDAQPIHPFLDLNLPVGNYVVGVARTGSVGSPNGITGNPAVAGDAYRLNVSVANHALGTGPAVIGKAPLGPLTKTVTVTINSDLLGEGDEQFGLVLENQSQGQIYAIDEIEPNQTNNSILTAQNVDNVPFSLAANANITNATTVPHITINGTGDGTFDYYSFTVGAGDTVTFDIDGANFDSELFVFDPLTLDLVSPMAQNDNAATLDQGSSSTFDSFLTFTFNNAGTYVVGVGAFDSVGGPGGITGAAPQTGDVYSLHLSITNKATSPGTPVVAEIDRVQNVDGAAFGLGANPNIQNSTTVPHLSIDGLGDGTFDYYSFTVGAGRTVTFDIDDANFDTQIFLYDPATGKLVVDGLQPAENDNGGLLDAGSLSTTDSFLEFTFTNGGTYVVGVARSGSVGANGGIVGNAPQPGDAYTLHLSIPGHALNFGLATILDDDPRLTIDDFTVIEGNDPMNPNFAEFTVTLTDGNGTPILAKDDILVDFTTSLGSGLPLAAPGQIYENAVNSTFAVPQALDPRAFVLTSNPNITGAQGIDTSTTIRHLTVLGRGNNGFDYYSFNGTAGQRVILDIDGATFDSQLFVYDAAGNVVFSNDDGFPNGGPNGNARDTGSISTEDAFLDFVLTNPGRYTIAVGRGAGDSMDDPSPTVGLTGTVLGTGDTYTLHISLQNFFAPPGTIFEADLSTGMETIPNNSVTAPRSLEGEHFNTTLNPNINNASGANVSQTIPYVIIQGSGDGTPDFYSFNAVAGQIGIFDIDGASFDSTLTLFDPNNQQVAFNDDSPILDAGSTTTLDSLLQIVFAQTGTYKIQVRDLSQGVSPALVPGSTYTLNVAVGGHALGTPPTFGGPRPLDGTANPGSDFDQTMIITSSMNDPNPTMPGVLRIRQGESTGTIMVPIIGDTLNEPPSENFFVRLFNARYENIAGTPAIEDGAGEGIIANDDAPFIRISNPAPVPEAGPTGQPNLVQFIVSLHNADGSTRVADVTTTVNFFTTDGSAIGDLDYVPAMGTVTIPAGQSQTTINVTLIKDGLLGEPNETFFVQLDASTAMGAEVDANFGIGQGTIIDNTARVERVFTVVAPDAGQPGIVRVIDSFNNATRFQVEPYPGFLGGVRVATGDINNDGTADIITAPGPGGGPHVKVFSGVDGSPLVFTRDPMTNAILFEGFFAFDPGFTGGLFVATGDFAEGTLQLGDSFDDIIIGADVGGGAHIRTFGSAIGPNNARVFNDNFALATVQAQNRLLFDFIAFPGFTGGVRVAAGDVTGDGTDDLVIAPGPGGGPNVQVFNGRTRSTTPIRSFFAYDPRFTGGVYVAVGDVNINTPSIGRAAEIITGPGAGGGPHVRVFNVVANVQAVSEFFAYAPGFTGGVRVSTGDVNGDTFVDVITAPGPGGGPHVRGFSGTTIPGATVSNPPLAFELVPFPYGPQPTGLFVAGVLDVDSGSPLRAAEIGGGGIEATVLTQADIDAAVEAALDRLREAGVSEAQIDELSQVYVTLGNLSGDLVGLSTATGIVLDVDAAGNGWFIDPTPDRDEEFAASANGLSAVDASAAGRTDLLTVVLHELGHKLGLGDIHSHLHPDALMNSHLPVGTRRLPTAEELDGAFTDDSLFDSLLLD